MPGPGKGAASPAVMCRLVLPERAERRPRPAQKRTHRSPLGCHALDDPFTTTDAVPNPGEVPFRPRDWLEERIRAFLGDHL